MARETLAIQIIFMAVLRSDLPRAGKSIRRAPAYFQQFHSPVFFPPHFYLIRYQISAPMEPYFFACRHTPITPPSFSCPDGKAARAMTPRAALLSESRRADGNIPSAACHR